ncbi:hypothetical protein CSUI_006399 [Cystoisospora suis]|uniref:Transmembrane protein n=1 Tax=Cystoisospora suis TaxID=483139 RepID=A0A2C6KH05_9APIC|nr:hypothetical protein CSUI_006399 [Cystoisospora suis]
MFLQWGKMGAGIFRRAPTLTLSACFFAVAGCAAVCAASEVELTATHWSQLNEQGHHNNEMDKGLPGEEGSGTVYMDRAAEDTRNSRSLQGTKRRLPTQALASRSPSSSRRFNKLSSSTLKPTLAAVSAVVALAGTVLPTSRTVFTGPPGGEKLPPLTGLLVREFRVSPLSRKLLVVLTVLIVICAASAAPITRASPTKKKVPPPVAILKQKKRTPLVRIGRDWVDGKRKSGYNPITLYWKHHRYELRLSRTTEFALGGLMGDLESWLSYHPVRSRHAVWEWGSRDPPGGGELFYRWTRPDDGLKCELFLPREIADTLREGDARDDFLLVINTFLGIAPFPRSYTGDGQHLEEKPCSSWTAPGGNKLVQAMPQGRILGCTGKVLHPGGLGMPPVKEGILLDGESVVLVGRDWNDESNRRKQGYNPIPLTFQDKKFLLYLSRETETYLDRRSLLSGVRDTLSGIPKRHVAGDRVFWQWGKDPPDYSFFDNPAPAGSKHQFLFFLPEGAVGALWSNENYPDSWNAYRDLSIVLHTFYTSATASSDPPTATSGVDAQQAAGGESGNHGLIPVETGTQTEYSGVPTGSAGAPAPTQEGTSLETTGPLVQTREDERQLQTEVAVRRHSTSGRGGSQQAPTSVPSSLPPLPTPRGNPGVIETSEKKGVPMFEVGKGWGGRGKTTEKHFKVNFFSRVNFLVYLPDTIYKLLRHEAARAYFQITLRNVERTHSHGRVEVNWGMTSADHRLYTTHVIEGVRYNVFLPEDLVEALEETFLKKRIADADLQVLLLAVLDKVKEFLP